MSANLRRVAATLKAAIDKSISAAAVDVVIMGPALPEPGKVALPAAALREILIRNCESWGAAVAPEHGIIRAAATGLGTGHDLCTYEHFVVTHCDLLVIVPDSAGSLCELGYFAMQQDTCKKMIILHNERYPAVGSYVAEGPTRAALQHRAIVHYIDYNDVNAAWALVRAPIEVIRTRRALMAIS
jgi:hypothetical protein